MRFSARSFTDACSCRARSSSSCPPSGGTRAAVPFMGFASTIPLRSSLRKRSGEEHSTHGLSAPPQRSHAAYGAGFPARSAEYSARGCSAPASRSSMVVRQTSYVSPSVMRRWHARTSSTYSERSRRSAKPTSAGVCGAAAATSFLPSGAVAAVSPAPTPSDDLTRVAMLATHSRASTAAPTSAPRAVRASTVAAPRMWSTATRRSANQKAASGVGARCLPPAVC
mmetsp:Transcript_23671/g.76972  ORF Transcript_23671/g.76972 Transcript_23671/m.76972 type:complete len:225 (-) Transcript_23671:1333-2007(-)